MLHQAKVTFPNTLHHIMRGHNRQVVFGSDEDFEYYRESLNLFTNSLHISHLFHCDKGSACNSSVKPEMQARSRLIEDAFYARGCDLTQLALSRSKLIGSSLILTPVAANIALAMAGATGGTPGSPIPPILCLLSAIWTSTSGTSDMVRSW